MKMSLLETILDLKEQGISDDEIIEQLRQQGFSPKEIHDAFSQLKIRQAVSQEYNSVQGQEQAYQDPSQYAGQYPQQDYSGYQEPSGEALGEMVDHVVEEKLQGVHKSVSEVLSAMAAFEVKFKDFDRRLQSAEEQLRKLQEALIGKFGEYTKDVKSIKEEMGVMQESFSKALNPLADALRRVDSDPTDESQKTEEKSEESSSGFDVFKRLKT